MNKFISVLVILLSIISCQNEPEKKVDVSGIDVDVFVDRFDQKFYETTAESLPIIKGDYPFLFPEQNHDSIWLNRINNIEEIELYKKAQVIFGNFEIEKTQIKALFKHIKYYHPTFNSPQILTLISNIDFQNKVLYSENFLFISLDMYLGGNDEVYNDFPMYLAHNFDKSQLSVDIANAIGRFYFSPPNSRQFVDLLINEGKKMYQLDCYLPNASDAQKIGYSFENIEWATSNEVPVWKFFIENKLLYSTDSDLYTRFISDAPFSKFFIDIDKESPGRIGVWLGWQIVRSYMRNNNVTLQQLLETNSEEIFKNSKYKPKK